MKSLMLIMTSSHSNVHLYPFVKDTYNRGRVCMEVKYLNRIEMVNLLADIRFNFISNSTAYFEGVETLDEQELECYKKQIGI